MAKKLGKTIVFEIGADGTMTADAEGFVKDACLKELDDLLKNVQALPIKIERKEDAAKKGKPKITHNTQHTQTIKRKR